MKQLIAIAFVIFCMVPGRARAEAPSKPNIIFILADDLGLDGVSAYGADKHRTPSIDALAASGIRFQNGYASPLCGPSRCLLMSGRYAFRTGGITNQSWRPNGPGAKSADEFPIARLLKEAGYATGQAGKWRQVGELPGNWGFDEFITDNTAGGWYWQTKFNKNGTVVDLPEGTYGPDVVQEFTYDFIRRHRDKPFFFYYANHLVHKPTLRTPDTSAGTRETEKLYDDNIRYMDKQVGGLVAELEKLGLRKNTLIVFAGDNGTAAGYPSLLKGRMIHGAKGSMLEGGSHVPFIASWPGVTPAGKVLEDLVSFADPYATFAEVAGAKLPANLTIDGKSFAPQLRGEAGTPRSWAYVQLGSHWFVREPGFKMNEKGELFDMSDAPFTEKLIAAEADTEQSKAGRQRLTAALAGLNPAGGKTDNDGKKAGAGKKKVAADEVPHPALAVGPWKSGDVLQGADAPDIDGKPFEVSAEIESTGTGGVIVSQGGATKGYAVYLKEGKLTFSIRDKGEMTTIAAKDALGNGHFVVQAALHAEGAMVITVDGKQVAEGKTPGLISQPKAGLFVGKSGKAAVGDYEAPAPFDGTVTNVRVKATSGK